MKSFICYVTTLILLIFQTRAIQLNSVSSFPNSYVEIADKVSTSVSTEWINHLDSFIDLVSTKIVDNIENEISNTNNDKLTHLVALLENDADLFDVDSYQNKDLSFIENEFFSKLKEKFNNSKFGQHIKKLKANAKEKLKELYAKHKDKLKRFFKIMLTTLVIPVAIKYIKKHLNQWRQKTLDATKKLDPDTKKITVPVITAIYDKFGEQIDKYAEKNGVNFEKENEGLKELLQDKQDIEKIERQEAQLLYTKK
ncbi:uncharacterized protein LOC111533478 [Piliocolobus tephrosceles]|uniref:uncharacterized protein LOC111533478 n=1 Tax=Piliocolobus tephrosceles TaxID=591936 RepID=UPI000C2A751C|nr:uncharacterized protein LOC111533478 [Piliocolobus tephrosceles]